MTDSTANAVLQVDGFEERDVHEYKFAFTQEIDSTNMPSGLPYGGKIYVKIKANREHLNVELLNWMRQSAMKKNGRIVVKKPGTEDNLMEIIFKDAYCVDYQQYWKDVLDNEEDGLTFYEELWITWREFEVDSVTFENSWKLAQEKATVNIS
jgi:hypothetical protein